jgi:hypothetical protein
MRLRWIAVMSVAAVVALAPQAFAMGGGGGGNGGGSGPVSGTFSGTANGSPVSGTFDASVNGTMVSGTANLSGPVGGGGTGGTRTLSAAEPLSAFAVGLGLIGARLLRRRR